MADNTPNLPTGAVPPKPGDAAKIQPKKETVRISLPPKPTAAPTVRLPSLPPAGATAAAPAHGVGAPAVAPAAPAPAAPAPASRPTMAAPPAARPAPALPGGARAAAPARAPAARSNVDLILAVVAALMGLLVLGRVLLLAALPS